MRRIARLTTLAILVLGMLGIGSAAWALSSPDAIGASLRQSPVYNDPDAENALSPSDEVRLLDQVNAAGTPIYIAVLPQSFFAQAGSPDAALNAVARATGQAGAYAVIGVNSNGNNTFRANSTLFPVNDIATRAAADNKGGSYYSVLSQFVSGVSERAATGGGGNGSGGSGSNSSGFPWGWVLVGGSLAGIGGVTAYSIKKSKRQAMEQLAAVKGVVDEDVTSFGEKVAAYDISDPRLDDAARADLMTAIDSYQKASDASDRMRTATDASAVTNHLEDGRYAMACVEARIEGRPLPERRPPCFFDPRHGPSTQDVSWAPPGGQPRDVPACATCAATAARGYIPQSREVPVGAGDTRPYWGAGPMYGPYAGGYYQSYGSILPQIMIGTMLGNALFPSTTYIDNSGMGGGFGPSGGGDAGGGGFGGFGGGGFDGGGFGDFSGGSGGGDF